MISEFEQNRAFEGQFLNKTPKHQIKAGVVHRNPYINYSVYGLHKTSQLVYTNEPRGEIARISGFTVLNAKAWRHIGKNLTLTISVDNVLNERYTGTADEKAPGGLVLLTLRYGF